jgi:CheY-like chemotaxis protein
MFEREKHKILMVEDNSSNHELFTDVFMNEDHHSLYR